MMALIFGGSGSGKSAYAEQVAEKLSMKSGGQKYYLATMRILDAEGQRKVERHREVRSGKGFLTIEQPVQISHALEKMEAGERIVLLECLSNLTANEMFSEAGRKTSAQTVEIIWRDLKLLWERTAHLIVVSSNVFEDGMQYDDATMAYIRAMGELQQEISAMADFVAETVVGIPLILKGNEA